MRDDMVKNKYTRGSKDVDHGQDKKEQIEII